MHPLTLVRITGILDGISLIILLGIAMPLKYWADIPYAVTLVGTIHGWIVLVFMAAVLYAQIRLQWKVTWTLLCIVSAFVPLVAFVLEHALRRRKDQFAVKPIPVTWLVYAIILFTFLDLFTQLPVMSTYATSLGASVMVAGFIVGMYSLTNTFGNVMAGLFTDRYGAPAVLKAGLLFTSIALLLYNFVDHVETLLFVRFLHGFLGGLIVPAAFTYMANRTRNEQQGSRSAIIGSFVGIAAVVGPAYSGIMASRTSVPFVFSTIAVLGLVLFVGAVLWLKTSSGQAPKRGKRKVKKLALNGGMLRAFLGAFFLMFSQGALAYLLPQHVESLGYDSRLSGTLMSLFGIVAVAIFALPTNKLFDRLPPVWSFAIGLGFMGAGQMLISQSASSVSLYAVLALYGVGFAFLFPAINALLAHSTVPENRGQAYGVFYALFSAGTVVGSLGLGLLPLSIEHQFIVTGSVLIICALGVFFASGKRGSVGDSEGA